MKILTLIDSYGAGGAQNQLSLITAALNTRGHEVHSFHYFDDDFFAYRLTEAGVTQHMETKSGKLGFNVVSALIRLYNQQKFDVVLAYLNTPNFYAALARKLARHKPAVVVSHRGRTTIDTLPLPIRAQRFWTNNQAAAVICNSYHERDNWLQVQPKLPIFTVYNGIKDPLANGSLEPQHCPPDVTDTQPSLPTLLAVGTVTKIKNAESIVAAMAQLHAANTLNFKLIWVGSPKANLAEDLQYLDQIKALIKVNNLEKHWIWAGQTNNPLAFYRYADALIHASVEEGLPNVICEAQIAGLPVFASDLFDHSKMIVENVSGYCFNHENTNKLAHLLHAYFNKTDEEKLAFRQASRASALNLFDLDKCVAQYESILTNASQVAP